MMRMDPSRKARTLQGETPFARVVIARSKTLTRVKPYEYLSHRRAGTYRSTVSGPKLESPYSTRNRTRRPNVPGDATEPRIASHPFRRLSIRTACLSSLMHRCNLLVPYRNLEKKIRNLQTNAKYGSFLLLVLSDGWSVTPIGSPAADWYDSYSIETPSLST